MKKTIKKEELLNEVENGEVELKATGVKESVGDIERIKEPEIKEEEKKHDLPLFFIDEEKYIRVEVDIIFDPVNGRPRIMISAPNFANKDALKTLKHHRIWADFTQPSYDDMVIYREACLSWNEEIKQFLADPIKMRLHYLRYHLKDWNITDNKGNKVELEIDENTKGLISETMGKIGKISPAVLDVMLTEFEKESLLM